MLKPVDASTQQYWTHKNILYVYGQMTIKYSV